MARLIYIVNMSLDGFMEDENGNFDWSEPSEDQHRFINDLARPAGTHLYGRRMYETMSVWETDPSLASHSAVTAHFARLWQDAQKIVYSTSLASVSTTKTRLERRFDAEAVARMKRELEQDILIGGPGLARHAMKAGLVDAYHFFIAPVALGRGKRALPDDTRLDLELRDQRRFENGVVQLGYGVRP